MTRTLPARAGTSSADAGPTAAVVSPVPTPWTQVAALVAGVVALLSILLTFFAWPAVRSDLRNVPLVVAGPPQAVAQVESRLEAARPGGFDLCSGRCPPSTGPAPGGRRSSSPRGR